MSWVRKDGHLYYKWIGTESRKKVKKMLKKDSDNVYIEHKVKERKADDNIQSDE